MNGQPLNKLKLHKLCAHVSNCHKRRVTRRIGSCLVRCPSVCADFLLGYRPCRQLRTLPVMNSVYFRALHASSVAWPGPPRPARHLRESPEVYSFQVPQSFSKYGLPSKVSPWPHSPICPCQSHLSPDGPGKRSPSLSTPGQDASKSMSSGSAGGAMGSGGTTGSGAIGNLGNIWAGQTRSQKEAERT